MINPRNRSSTDKERITPSGRGSGGGSQEYTKPPKGTAESHYTRPLGEQHVFVGGVHAWPGISRGDGRRQSVLRARGRLLRRVGRAFAVGKRRRLDRARGGRRGVPGRSGEKDGEAAPVDRAREGEGQGARRGKRLEDGWNGPWRKGRDGPRRREEKSVEKKSAG
ncbi:hypothetical protein KM043_006910 [Ampulex compressa]|nr:hypothetical protein KM043_006910 [Ampulex compressa]